MALEESISKLADALLVLASAIDRNTKGTAPAQDPKPAAEKPKAEKPKAEKPAAPPAPQPGTTAPTEGAALTYEKDLKPALLAIGDTEKIREFLKVNKYESGPSIQQADYAKVIAAAKAYGPPAAAEPTSLI
jgi:hypothetical protein